jgi:hypothetical protein
MIRALQTYKTIWIPFEHMPQEFFQVRMFQNLNTAICRMHNFG